ncbi:MAG: hypothetical protein HWQ58_36275 [Nostoc sp. LPT]|uniref:element excision factor XisH family protein n=1 Tax=uncultured Nostoc sp. TaxID=340711 RepID=UPI001D7C5FF9|nr:element excision factor XisH family protein [Nostoc sp. LPT]MBN4006892.1 hypothetical protein [Nostoc sp. LPT]
MSAKDIFHESVKKALQKEQWIITSDPLKFKFGEVSPFGEVKSQKSKVKHFEPHK